MEYRMGAEWSDEQMEHITEADLKRGQIEIATTYPKICRMRMGNGMHKCQAEATGYSYNLYRLSEHESCTRVRSA